MSAFEATGPLPTGTTVLEASAGTGKTHAVAGLVTRYVAEGAARVEDLLVVTFGRAATGELRSRVRERLVRTRDALADPAAVEHGDEVVRHLAGGDPGAVRRRRELLAAALASFDAATITTVHGFCQQVLTGLGTAADADPGAALVEDLSDLVEEVCDDLHLRWAVRQELPFDRACALRVARQAVARADARLEPAERAPGTPEDLRVRFATAVRAEVARRKAARRVLGFDDLLVRLRDALADPVTGPVACARLRERYRLVLVDEFQDTDAVQWDVLRLAFHGVRPLVLVGDPKQAIYAFRGADVRSYLAARDAAAQRATLDVNRRSDPAVVHGVQELLRGAALGEEGIVVHEVRPAHERAALVDAAGREDPAPVRLRVLPRADLPTDRGGLPLLARARSAVAADVAAQVASVLGSGLRVRPRDGAGEETGGRPLAAGDVAVLVRTRTQARLVQEALQRAGLPCVLSRGPSVFGSEAARDWLVLLEALEQPHRTARVRRLVLSAFVGSTAEELDAGGERATDAAAVRLRTWAAVLAERGVAGLFAAVAEEHALPARLLGTSGGERRLTDLRHVCEVLHAEAAEHGRGPAGLLAWLRARVDEADGDVGAERSRRLDTDRAAVQVATVHTSKGLEFEVVCVPFGWDVPGPGPARRERLPVAHAPAGAPAGTGAVRTLHVGGTGSPGYAAACAAADAECAGEELRLLYVALTRAVSRLLVWWAPSRCTAESPLHRLLFAPDARALPPAVPVPPEADALAHLRRLDGTGTGVRLERAGDDGAAPAAPPPAAPAALLPPAVFGGRVDALWRRTSYSGLTRDVHEAPLVRTGPEAPGTVDEVDLEGVAAGAGEPADPVLRRWREVPSPLADLPAGAGFGTLVHAVLEDFDPAAPDRPAHLAALAREQFAGALAEPLAAALDPVLRTPLGPLAGGAALEGFAVPDRLAELDFELPLGGGDRAGDGDGALLGQVADLLRRHLDPDDPVHPYADALAEPALGGQVLRGYLTGSIDAVLRRRGPGGPAHLVVDYKTNRLAGPGEALTAWHYRREALDDAVREAHYPLQALLYCVALHRFLRWRQPGYDPAVHLGGVLYLFLRGMCGPDVPAATGPDGAPGAPPGVWSWCPPPALVTDVSDLLAGRPR
ncbi:UvrD-helicase domain-containing protein [Paenibacillus sp. TRM 82003]|uniref:UvrD-helicase domain-containing protein n=1 Tax=Kineococcus sp. TRM81007 TaxID=2925831 RepID=UPI001F586B13|nr:UvrD-helicase domain-containing protein [Kineococcus sp. TRM81007]MCI2238503.1 UvrD-helicase domain-containing protein [Kineococcus sp. TRM81007]MCI3921984.1 UvrD-helicase domain-containing protein [Paenibacillus sp. TRM 82003]